MCLFNFLIQVGGKIEQSSSVVLFFFLLLLVNIFMCLNGNS